MKTCSKCGLERAIYAECKPCRAAAQRVWRAAHPGYHLKHYQDNKARIKARSSSWAKANRPKVNAVKRAAYNRNPEKHRAIAREYAAQHREKSRIKARAWYKENKERAQEAAKKWVSENKDASNLHKKKHALLKVSSGYYSLEEWQAIIERQKGRCADCGVKKKLEADHINPLSKGGCNYAFNIQGLCRTCNAKKHNHVSKSTPISLFDKAVA